MRKMSINFQLILFAFIIKSISSNNLVSKTIELINGNDSTKSSINAFINKHKDILDNISNDLLLLYNNNFDTKFLLNKKEYSEANSPLIFFVKLELENLKNKINNHTNISSILDEYNTKLSLLGSILNNNNISFHLENYEKYIIQLHQNYSQNIIDFIELLLQKNNTNHIKFVVEILMNYLVPFKENMKRLTTNVAHKTKTKILCLRPFILITYYNYITFYINYKKKDLRSRSHFM
jgi:hypothetical protein